MKLEHAFYLKFAGELIIMGAKEAKRAKANYLMLVYGIVIIFAVVVSLIVFGQFQKSMEGRAVESMGKAAGSIGLFSQSFDMILAAVFIALVAIGGVHLFRNKGVE